MTCEKKLEAQSENGNGELDTVSGQVQTLNESVDELKSRIAELDKSIQDMQTQLQTPQALPARCGPVDPRQRGTDCPTADWRCIRRRRLPPATAATTTVQAPPLEETYKAGVRDYNTARYDVAAGEFQDVLHYYPLDDLAGNADFYLGEIAYRPEGVYADAIKSYNAVLEGFSGSAEAPAAQLREGLALLQGGARRYRHAQTAPAHPAPSADS